MSPRRALPAILLVALAAGLPPRAGAADPPPPVSPGGGFLPEVPMDAAPAPPGPAEAPPTNAAPGEARAPDAVAGTPAPPVSFRDLPEGGAMDPEWWRAVPKIDGEPPFRVLCYGSARDISRVWWQPEHLALRYSPSGPGGSAVEVPMLRGPTGAPTALLVGRIPVGVTEAGRETESAQVVIRQGAGLLQIAGGWSLSLSPMAVHLARGSEERELLSPSAGHGAARLRVPEGGMYLYGWVGCALDGARAGLARELDNEELRLLLVGAGEAVWRIAPGSPAAGPENTLMGGL